MLPSKGVRFTLRSVISLTIFGWICGAHAREHSKLLGVRAQGDDAIAVIAVLGDRPLTFTAQKLSGPPRIVVDFADTEISGGSGEMQVDDGTIRRVAAGPARPSTARVVIELAADAEFDVRAAGSQVEVRVPRIKPLPAKAGSEADQQPLPPTVAVMGPRAGELPAEKRAAAAKAMIDKFSATEKAREEKRTAEEKALAEKRAAADKKLAEQRASADRKLAASRAAEDKKLAAERSSSDKALAAERAREKVRADREAVRLAAESAAADKAAAAARAKAQAEAERKAERAALLARIERERRRFGQITPPAPRSRTAWQRLAWADSSERAITGIGFRPQGGGEVIIRSDQPLEYGISGDDRAVLLHLPSAGIPRSNDRWPLDTSFFNGVVQRVVPLPVPGGTDLRIELRAHAEYQLAQSGSVLTVTFARP